MNHPLEKDILTTLVYWDVFAFPLTTFEVWKHRISSARLVGRERSDSARLSGKDAKEGERVSLGEVYEVLDVLERKNLIAQTDGMFSLKGRESLAERRRTRGKRSDGKLAKFQSIVRWLRFVPFVRMIGVTGRLSYKNVSRESDWDVFIVLKAGRIWTGRTLVTGFLHLIGKRRHGIHEKDRVCLNHFLTDESLEIGLKDLFAAREYSLLLPLYGWETFQKFQQENTWIQEFIPEWNLSDMPPLFLLSDSRLTSSMKKILEQILSISVFDMFERQLKHWQTKKIEKNPKTHLPEGFIRATDEALIFLPDPQGPKVFEKFVERLGALSSKQ